MVLIYKIKSVDEANKSRVSCWSFPFGTTVQIQSRKKIIQGFADKPGLEYLFEYSLHNSVATFYLE